MRRHERRGRQRGCPGRDIRWQHLAAHVADAHAAPEHRTRRGRAERHHHGRSHRVELGLEPRAAGDDVRHRWLLVDAPLAAPLEAEVLHRIRDVDQLARDAGRIDRLGEEAPSGSDERLALEILPIPGLLADEHERRTRRAPSREHDLGGIPPEFAAAALLGGATQLLDVATRRDPLPCARTFGISGHAGSVGALRGGRERVAARDRNVRDDACRSRCQTGRMRIAVTGGSGKLGRTVVRTLREEGNEVVNLDRFGERGDFTQVDLTDYGQVIDAIAGIDDRHDGVDAIVHLAALPAPGLASDVATFHNNMLSTFNVFQAAKRLGITRIVYASSETVLGLPFDVPPPYIPVDEEYPARPESTYSLVKHLEEQMAIELVRWNPELSITALRFSNVMDPADYDRIPVVRRRRDRPQVEPLGLHRRP